MHMTSIKNGPSVKSVC